MQAGNSAGQSSEVRQEHFSEAGQDSLPRTLLSQPQEGCSTASHILFELWRRIRLEVVVEVRAVAKGFALKLTAARYNVCVHALCGPCSRLWVAQPGIP